MTVVDILPDKCGSETYFLQAVFYSNPTTEIIGRTIAALMPANNATAQDEINRRRALALIADKTPNERNQQSLIDQIAIIEVLIRDDSPVLPLSRPDALPANPQEEQHTDLSWYKELRRVEILVNSRRFPSFTTEILDNFIAAMEPCINERGIDYFNDTPQ